MRTPLLLAAFAFLLTTATADLPTADADIAPPPPRNVEVLRQFRITGFADSGRHVVLALLRGGSLEATRQIADNQTFPPFSTAQETGGDDKGAASWRVYAVAGDMPETLTLDFLDRETNRRMDPGDAFKRRTTTMQVNHFQPAPVEIATYTMRFVTTGDEEVIRLRLTQHVRMVNNRVTQRLPVPRDDDDNSDDGSDGDDGSDEDGDGMPAPGDDAGSSGRATGDTPVAVSMVTLVLISMIALAMILVTWRRR